MNKTRMTLAVMGGVIGLAVLAAAYFTWSALAAKTAAMEGDDDEGVDGLETVVSKAQTLSRKPVYPCTESVKAIDADVVRVSDWQAEAKKLAIRGDRVYPKTTPAAFKTFIVSDAKRLSALPGLVNGALVKPGFAFGPFKDYISEGKMPAEAELAELQRKWDDVATVAGILSKCGASELVDVGFAAVNKEQGTGNGEQEKKGNKKSGKAKGKKVQDDVQRPLSQSYVFTFLVRPSAFVRTVNELTANERFITVDAFTFDRVSDVIAEALGGDEKKENAAASGGRRGRRGRLGNGEAVSRPLEEEEKSVQKNGIITDPLLDEPFKAVMTVSVHDFRSLEEKDEADAEEKGAAK